MFTFLKNRFVQIAVATVGGERITASTALNQQQQKFSATAAAAITVGPNLMDERYFLSKFEEYEKSDSWDYVFQNINFESDSQAKKLNLCCDLSNNFHEKNRYRNVLPYDQNRITLQCVGSDQDTYINASPLHLPFARRNYILTQGPLPNTASDFWQMVYEQKVSICIMLSKVMEKSFIKCHSYFPCKEAPRLKFELFDCELEHEEIKPNYIIRRIRLTPSESFKKLGQAGQVMEATTMNQSRIIHHFQFTTWPDFGVPEHTNHFLEFLEEVRAAREKLLDEGGASPSSVQQENTSAKHTVNNNNSSGGGNKSFANAPIVCHCSAGIGRTGTFVIVDSVLSMIEKKRHQQQQLQDGRIFGAGPEEMTNNGNELEEQKVEEELDSLEALVIFIRKHRMGLIQTAQQLRFCWKTIVDWIKKSQEENRLQSPQLQQQQAVTASANSSSSTASSASPNQQRQKETPSPSIAATTTDIRWSVSPEPTASKLANLEQQPQHLLVNNEKSPTTTADANSTNSSGNNNNNNVSSSSANSSSSTGTGSSNSSAGGSAIRTRKRSNNERDLLLLDTAPAATNSNGANDTVAAVPSSVPAAANSGGGQQPQQQRPLSTEQLKR